MPARKRPHAEGTDQSASSSSHTLRTTAALQAAKRMCAVAGQEQLTEEHLTEKEKKQPAPSLPLKNGAGEMDMNSARSWEEHVRDLMQRYPEHFRALIAVLDGHADELSKEHRRDLIRWSYLLRDGSPHPDIQAIMTAAYRQTPDGPCLVDPLDPKTPEDVTAMLRYDEHLEMLRQQGPERVLRDLRAFKKDRDEGKGRPR